MQVSVYRYNPETDDRPYMSDFTVDIPEGRDLMVLDVMAMIKEKDPSVSYRRSPAKKSRSWSRPSAPTEPTLGC